MVLHEGHGIKTSIGMVAGVETDFQEAFIHFARHTFNLRFKIHKTRSMSVDRRNAPMR